MEWPFQKNFNGPGKYLTRGCTVTHLEITGKLNKLPFVPILSKMQLKHSLEFHRLHLNFSYPTEVSSKPVLISTVFSSS